ncbi:vanadium-dependent haloperoxidase [Zunongwangia endophytica]|uniref:Vanadium-dependent haloperoxidase n=1 Tax=Zunongwangia endophytica TaxID=1808945 RepID=A0ABV8HEZ8_9FLAO|nr:vanadium-dependent haloperoxidase [Zunongwangia endophytica]MDN3593816.1 vanadium-dependent haloperoxidase [Zunongwangia endophytica]
MRKALMLLLSIAILSACADDKNTNIEALNISALDYHASLDQITNIMVHDIFSPPVASRIYSYANLAAYEIVAQHNPELESLTKTINADIKIPVLDTTKNIDYKMAALIAQLEIGKTLIFSEAEITNYRDSLFVRWKENNEEIFLNSETYGMQVADAFKRWIDKDNYKETRTMPKFSVYTEDVSRWQPTPPTYMDGIEPHWMKIRPFTLDSASQFKPKPHPEFSMKVGSVFYKELMEVYEVRNQMDKTGNKSEELSIAKFWDCNPYVSTQRGHLMFATKKITPGGHWIGITKIASQKANLDFDKTVYAYTTISIGIADAFISCWDEKYSSNLIRPETLINKFIDDQWKPVLQTPPFPEYTSGHSVVSGTSAEILTQLFGDQFQFLDDTEVRYGLPQREYTSFRNAAQEAALSRLYGGIHYRAAIENGLEQGIDLGKHVVNTLNVKAL